MPAGGVRVVVGVTLVVLVVASASLAVPAAAVGPDPSRPAVPADAPDPEVLVVGGAYYLFTTQVGFASVPVRTSTNLTTFSQPADALPTLGAWADWGSTWSPAVHRFGSTYVLFYTAHDRASGVQCIGRATSAAPQGPYHDPNPAPFLCQPELGGSIDADIHVAPGGQPWLLWKADGNAIGRPSEIWSAPLTADGSAFAGFGTVLVRSGPGDDGIVENPSMVHDGTRTTLVFSVDQWWTGEYRMERATCTGPQGPCTRAGRPWIAPSSGLVAPGGGSLFRAIDGSWQLAVHAWQGAVGYEAGGVRATWIGGVDPSAAEVWGRPPVLLWFLSAAAAAGPPQQAYAYGPAGARPLGCDGDGDGRDTSWIESSGTWHQRDAVGPGAPTASFQYGAAGYTSVCGDWDGDGDDTVGVFVGGWWYLRNAPGPGAPDVSFAYGTSGYVPVVGDWDGNGADSIGVYVRGSWYLRNTLGPGSPQVSFAYGTSGYVPVVGDWDGNGADSIGVYVGGSWYLRNTLGPGSPQVSFAYGTSGYVPVVGDWDDDALDEPGVVTVG